MSRKVHLPAVFARMSEYWEPHTVAQVNDYAVRVVKFHGDYHWHRHDHTDELFFCFRGGMVVQMRDREVALTEGELFVVPRGVEHRPIAHEEAHVLVFEPADTGEQGRGDGAR